MNSNPINFIDPLGLSAMDNGGVGYNSSQSEQARGEVALPPQLPFDQATVGLAGGLGLSGGLNVTFDVADPQNPQPEEAVLFFGLGVGGKVSGAAVVGRTFGEGDPATLGFGTFLGGGVFGIGGNLDTRIGITSPSVEITPSAGFVGGGFACFCVSVRIPLFLVPARN